MILKLESEVTNPLVGFVGLAGDSTTIADDEILTVVGYGEDFVTGRPEELQFVEVPFVDDETCSELYDIGGFGFVIVPDIHVCIGDTVNGGLGHCYGDSGKFPTFFVFTHEANNSNLY